MVKRLVIALVLVVCVSVFAGCGCSVTFEEDTNSTGNILINPDGTLIFLED